MKDSDRDFQVEGDKNKILGTEPSLQAQECLKTERKPMWMKPDKEMGKSSELRTRFFFLLVGG